MQFYEYRDFRKSLNALWRKGGAFQRAATEVEALLGRIASGEVDSSVVFRGMSRTNHGENRLRRCVKYDLARHSRLVTIQTDGYCLLLMCGSHDECDRWLENHKGLEPVVDPSRRIVTAFRSPGKGEDERLAAPSGHFAGPLVKRIKEERYDQLITGVSIRVLRRLEEIDATVTEGELWEVLASVEDAERRSAIYDVLIALRADRVIEAESRIALFIGDASPLETVEAVQLPELVDSDTIRKIDPRDPVYSEALRRFMQSATYKDWMVFLHPEQERVVMEDFAGAAKLIGVSGSGKTCVVVRRAVRLAQKYRDGKVLVITLNRALAALIEELVALCAGEEEQARIDVKPLFEVCRGVMVALDPRNTKTYCEVTWRGNEHVDEIWQEYYRCENNNRDASVMLDVHDSLISRGWSAEQYLREEVDWVRSALMRDERSEYFEMKRMGRTVPLTRQQRERILVGVAGWETKMWDVGAMDCLGVVQEVAKRLSQVPKVYRCVLVDEMQDLGTVELRVARALVPPGENDLFLCGDAAQAVTSKHQSLPRAGIEVPRASRRSLVLNYRNSRDVLQAAHETLLRNLTDGSVDREEFEILDPEFSAFMGATPLLLEGHTLEEEIRGALALAQEKTRSADGAKTCVAICGYSHLEVAHFGARLQLPVLDASASLERGSVFLSDLEQTKGFEFDMMCIVNCSAGILPNATAPEEEQHRDLARLYVAMTRARTDLVLSYSESASPFLERAAECFLRDEWRTYVDANEAPATGIPDVLEKIRDESEAIPWREMSGEQFLFSRLALGLPVDVSAKIRQLVNGKGLRRGNRTVRWRTMGSALDACAQDPMSRQLWGPEVARKVIDLAARLQAEGAG